MTPEVGETTNPHPKPAKHAKSKCWSTGINHEYLKKIPI
jgi:hypothetical protein